MGKTYYKVVSYNLKSARASKWDSENNKKYSTQYKVGEFVSSNAPGTKLFVFDNFESAFMFAENGEKIYVCEVINPKKAGYSTLSICKVAAFWKAYCSKKKISNFYPAIRGTVFCDAVKLLYEAKD